MLVPRNHIKFWKPRWSLSHTICNLDVICCTIILPLSPYWSAYLKSSTLFTWPINSWHSWSSKNDSDRPSSLRNTHPHSDYISSRLAWCLLILRTACKFDMGKGCLRYIIFRPLRILEHCISGFFCWTHQHSNPNLGYGDILVVTQQYFALA